MKAAEIRSKFLEFFENKGHTRVESSSLVPLNDPTLLFTAAGMVPFKDLFTGKEKRNYTRATSSQKCVRAGGKHNDLENVGFTARHHTFFEMLGNFSFGDYFKQEAIEYAWEFSTKVLKLPLDKLYITVYKDDDEAADIWKKVSGFSDDRIFRFGDKDNFWSMGDTGPCGPCSELFVDRGEHRGCKSKDCKVGCECDRFMEFWNLVFMQFDRDASGKMTPLPSPSVDTGGGLERIASILQDTETNYETDLFQEIISKIASMAAKKYDPSTELAFPFRVIADHARAATFLIGDGVLPANEGRGYVLRRIIRRAIRYGQKLGFDKAFLNEVCLHVVAQMKDAYPSLVESSELIEKAVRAEEEQFLKTLDRGLDLLDSELEKVEAKGDLSGEVAFKLYDTFGFPIDLTRIICEEKGYGVDEAGFSQSMAEQKKRSRENWKGSGQDGVSDVYHDVAEALKAENKTCVFTGYDRFEQSSECLSIITRTKSDKGMESEVVSSYDAGDKGSKNIIEAVFKESAFYPEGGGQVADKGRIIGPSFEADVVDVKKPVDGLITVHLKPRFGTIKVGEAYMQQTNVAVRNLTARNHTATHLLHWALREVLGTHVKQAGSLVNADLLRFDFTHFQPVTAEEISKIESIINSKIIDNESVGIKDMSKDDAIKEGAMAIFGEKYGDEVRVVKVGDFSVELCGGTHVSSAAEINLFKIASEAGVAAGVRRIVAYTSKKAIELMQERYSESQLLREKFKANKPGELESRIDKLVASEKDARKTIEKLSVAAMGSEIDDLIKAASTFSGGRLISSICKADDGGVKKLRDMSDRIREKATDALVVLGMDQPEQNKAFILAAVGKDVSSGVKANELISKLAPFIDGRGGGKPDMAQAGGTNSAGLESALKEAQKIVQSL